MKNLCKKLKKAKQEQIQNYEGVLKNYFFMKGFEKYSRWLKDQTNPNLENADRVHLQGNVIDEGFIDFEYRFKDEEFLAYCKNPNNASEIATKGESYVICKFVEMKIADNDEKSKEIFKDLVDSIVLFLNGYIDSINYSISHSRILIDHKKMDEGIKKYIESRKDLERECQDSKMKRDKWGNDDEDEYWNNAIYNKIFFNDNEYNKSLMFYKSGSEISFISIGFLDTLRRELLFKGSKGKIRVFYNKSFLEITDKGHKITNFWENPTIITKVSFSLSISSILIAIVALCLKAH